MIATRMPYLRSCSSIGIAVCSITIDSDWRRSSITGAKAAREVVVPVVGKRRRAALRRGRCRARRPGRGKRA